jgi:predicted enzyme involved in methoxymalonyl-ACP biosynthesis
MRCRDRYGDYGTVGFLVLDVAKPGSPGLRDLVMSCRVVKKKVEHALFEWLRRGLYATGARVLHATYLPTERNGILLDALRDVGFVQREERTGAIELDLDLTHEIPGGRITAASSSLDLMSPPYPASGGVHAG